MSRSTRAKAGRCNRRAGRLRQGGVNMSIESSSYRGRTAWRTALLSATFLSICGTAQAADPLVKACSKTGEFVIGFSQANNAEPYRQHVNDELTAAAKT